jgi:predicted negative regulator of RcsB-dependent stress response
MEVYSTEEQQEEAIKKAIKDNWLVVVIGAAIGLGGVYGWRYYDAMVIAEQAAASDAYDAIVEKANDDNHDLIGMAKQYIEKSDNKSYTVMLALTAAKKAIDKKNLAEGESQLSWALNNAQDDSFKAVIAVRLARVQAELQKHDEALATLANPLPASFTAQVEELRGDIYLKQGNTDKARSAYQLAADNDGLEGNNGLQYKMDNLAQVAPKL